MQEPLLHPQIIGPSVEVVVVQTQYGAPAVHWVFDCLNTHDVDVVVVTLPPLSVM